MKQHFQLIIAHKGKKWRNLAKYLAALILQGRKLSARLEHIKNQEELETSLSITVLEKLNDI